MDHDAAGTAGSLVAEGFRIYSADPHASDDENIERARQFGYSLFSMDMGLAHLGLRNLPFMVLLGGTAQRSASTATAQVHELRRLISEREITPGPEQRVIMNSLTTKVETRGPNGQQTIRLIRNRSLRKRRT